MADIYWQYDAECIIFVTWLNIDQSTDGWSHMKEHTKTYRLVYNLCIYLLQLARGPKPH